MNPDLTSFVHSKALNRLAELRGVAPPLWAPHPDNQPQIDAFESEADILLYGGAAGGGKTDLVIGAALTRHKEAIIFRRQYEQLKGIIERTKKLISPAAGRYNSQDKIWRLTDGRVLELGAVNDAGSEEAFQGRPHDYIAFDELAHFLESQFRFLIGWNRTTDPDQRCRVIASSNPPGTAEGQWIIRFWGPWLDEHHPDPAEPGELRWFASIGGNDVEVPGPEPFEHEGDLIKPRSRTFIPARVEDNPYLMATDYVSVLQAMPEPLRSMLREGRFDVSQGDDPWQVIPTNWIKIAQERWKAMPEPRDVPMTSVGVDVAQGGSNETVISPRRGAWFAPQLALPGSATPDGPAVVGMIVPILRDGAQVNIDVSGGWGNSAYEHLNSADIAVYGCNSSERSDGRTRDGKLGYRNKRAEWWWWMREALDPDYGEPIALPDDRGLLADLAAPRWALKPGAVIQIEEKQEIIKRLGRSPDKGDAAIYALAHEGLVAHRRKGRRTAKQTDSSYDRHRR